VTVHPPSNDHLDELFFDCLQEPEPPPGRLD
jgi:hypothetical protein